MKQQKETLSSIRFGSNMKILKLLVDLFEKFPDMRFGQLLSDLNYGVPDLQVYYEEPKATFERYKGYAEALKGNGDKHNKDKKDAKAKKPKKGKTSKGN